MELLIDRLSVRMRGCCSLCRLLVMPVLLLLLFGVARSAAADDLMAPLPVRNLYPPMMRFFDPLPDSALTSEDSGWSLALNQHYASVNINDSTPTASLLVDMELYLLEPVLRYAATPSLTVTLRAPLLLPASGLFDGAIQSFHHTFGFPNGGRELRPNNRFGYRFANRAGSRWQGANRAGFGNMVLSARYRLAAAEGWGLAALTALKLPTVSRSRGWGSGAADLAIGSVASWQQSGWFAHLEGWLIQPFAADEPGIRYDRYLRGSLTVGYQLHQRLALIVQAQGGNSPYQSGISALDHPPFLIAFGLQGVDQERLNWQISVVENITQVTTQDISVVFGLSYPLD